jgi:hypothetical protein
LTLVLTVLVVTSCGAHHEKKSGLFGIVWITGCPGACGPRQRPKPRPAAKWALVFSRDGRVAARVTTDPRGRYTIRLAPGEYTVSVAGGPPNRVFPDRVTVQDEPSRLDLGANGGVLGPGG